MQTVGVQCGRAHSGARSVSIACRAASRTSPTASGSRQRERRERSMSRICLYYRAEPPRDRVVRGDRFIRPWLRRLLRGPARLGGVDKVFANLCLGLDRLGIAYEVNLPFHDLTEGDRVGVLGRGRYALEGYDLPIPIVAGIGLMTHPSEWPDLCELFPIVR